MNCPVCETKLRTIERTGIEIDLCPDCKGVWLDRGELDKLVEMSAADYSVGSDKRHSRDQETFRDEHHDKHHDERHENSRGPKQGRRGSWLSDVLGSFGGED
jgi:uncharacterized protein